MTQTSQVSQKPAVGDAILDVSGLSVSARRGDSWLHLVRDIDLRVGRGEAVAIVGESGSGKSLTALGILQMLPSPRYRVTGHVGFGGAELVGMRVDRLRAVRGPGIGLVTQDALTGLDPVYTIGFQMLEAIRAHRKVSRDDGEKTACALMTEVGISDVRSRLKQYPHQLSGGMQQRVLLAMALINEPQLLIADEPTTALDVTVQAQIVRLLARESRKRHMSLILITHDLRLVAGFCDRIVVMYAGRIVETGAARKIYSEPEHPYTRALLDCALDLASPKGSAVRPIPGTAPDPSVRIVGCEFADRCARVMDVCREERPDLALLEGHGEVACHAVVS